MLRKHWFFVTLGTIIVGGLAIWQFGRSALNNWVIYQTGETALPAQIRALGLAALYRLHAQPELQPGNRPQLAAVNPYGINTFLEQEVEPAKREQQFKLLAQAGFYWARQEFPWYDIEIHGKGDFEDRRHAPTRSAWEKYDQIVALSQHYQIALIVRLGKPPDWAHSQTAGDFAPADQLNDYLDYVRAVATRYRGKIHHYQIWNEPNIYPEWGEQAVNPEAYSEMLCASYHVIKEIDPTAVVLAAALAPTIELGPRNLNEFLFLERMYAAGARECFDVLAAQGYGLWSGPNDHRLHPSTTNFNRHLYLRDLMIQNGDADKAVWITEMNWNAAPAELPAPYGRVSEAEQAQYLPEAFERAKREWPWVGAICVWFLKRAGDSERNQSWYYFRLLEPNFTPLPAFSSLQAYIAQHPYSATQP